MTGTSPKSAISNAENEHHETCYQHAHGDRPMALPVTWRNSVLSIHFAVCSLVPVFIVIVPRPR